MIRFACPNCEKVYKVPASVGGKPGACKKCGIRFLIPDAPVVEAEVVQPESTSLLPLPPPPPPEPIEFTEPPKPSLTTVPAVPEVLGDIPDLAATLPPPPPRASGFQFALAPPPPPPLPPPPLPTTELAPPPAPALPAIQEVDIIPCPKCRAELTVSESDVGNDVECPFCSTVYVAETPKPKAGT
ncbi:MAG: hypothetical protein MUF18_13330, partial [Fimbriiglobus sp.]|nr:hypothetical protein [Fimbriiglobus sp.]